MRFTDGLESRCSVGRIAERFGIAESAPAEGDLRTSVQVIPVAVRIGQFDIVPLNAETSVIIHDDLH